MISVERFIILCFLTQVSIGLSYAQSKDQDDTITKPTDYEINSQENKIEDGPFFFKINAKRNKPSQPSKAFTLPILEIPNFDGFDQKTAWQIYNNEKTSKVEDNQKDDKHKEKVNEFLKAEDIIPNESTSITILDDVLTAPERNYDEISRSENMSTSTITPDDELTTTESTSSRSEKVFVEPIHRSTYIYFYKPIDSPRTSVTSSTTQEDDAKDYTGMDHSALSSLGFGYPFFDNIFSIPGSNMRIKATPKIHHTQYVNEEDQHHNHGFSSLGFGYPFINNFHSFLDDEKPIKRAVAKVKIFSTNFEDDQPMEQDATSSSNEDVKEKETIKQDEIKDDKVHKSSEHMNFKDEVTLTKDEAHQKSANVEEILSSIMPIYDWATSSLLNMNMNQDILNIGKILRNSYYGSLAKVTDKKEEHSESQQPPPDVLPDVERDYGKGSPEPRSFVEEVLDEINEDSGSNRELNIERPPTDKDLPDIGSEDPKTIKPRSPAKCICGFSQGSTNSCSCFPETLVYYQYCSVPVPPTD